MNFELKDLQMIEAIHQQGTFAKAAFELNRTPSAITQSVKKLEYLLGFQVFDRSGYRPILTDAGRLFLERGKQILRQINRLETDLNLVKTGWETEFSIAYDDLISIEAILSLIQGFQKIAPHITLRLHREVLNGCWDALLHHRATLAIGASGEPPLELNASQKTLGPVDFVFAVAPHHPLAEIAEPLSKEALSMHYSIVVRDTSQDLPRRSSGILPGQLLIEVPNMDAKIQAQVQGLGVGYLPRHRVAELLVSGALLEKKVMEHQKSKIYLKTAWLTDNKSSQTLAWFLEKLDDPKIQASLLQSV